MGGSPAPGMDGVAVTTALTAASGGAEVGAAGVTVIGPNMPRSDQRGQSRLIAFHLPIATQGFPIG